ACARCVLRPAVQRGRATGLRSCPLLLAGRAPPWQPKPPDQRFDPIMLRKIWTLLRVSVNGFIDDGALSRGAAIAFYAITSIGPVLLIVVAVAGLVLGKEAARGALMGKLEAIMGVQAAAF